ncbi:hypothetical protein [Methylocapsa acidiphila]|uniref:hypothetical protein n=1 Tax=Methylocapsa acidiphila TaxID=133552 RepID=UPI0003FABFA8|nr:hypothetical protein [Methylocapsa acidiphila]
MANDDIGRLSSPTLYLARMIAFLILVGVSALIFHSRIAPAFWANPALNGLIMVLFGLGAVLTLMQVAGLYRETAFANALLRRETKLAKPPALLAPLARFFGDDPFARGVSPQGLRALLDSIAARLDGARDAARYLAGLLIVLGLLGTFWGLLQSAGSIGGALKSLQAEGDAAAMFEDLKAGVSAPIAGMALSFASALFGLAGSLALGFLDLQAGQAQSRFFCELEDRLTEAAAAAAASDVLAGLDGLPGELRAALEKIAASADQTHVRSTMIAVANLAEGVQALVQHMRAEQQMLRDWVEAEAEQKRELKAVLESLSAELKDRAECAAE